MNNFIKIVVAVVVVAAVAGGVLLTTNKSTSPATSKKPNASSSNSSHNSTDQSGEVAATITYDGTSFQTSSNSVTSGSLIKVINQSDSDLDFDSDPHPVHTDNPELNVGDIPAGESKTIKLTTKGTWGFHNHLDASQQGKITVE